MTVLNKTKDSVLFIQVNMQEACLYYDIVKNVKYVYIRCHICYIFIFYDYVGGKIIIKQRISNTNEMIELWRMAFY